MNSTLIKICAFSCLMACMSTQSMMFGARAALRAATRSMSTVAPKKNNPNVDNMWKFGIGAASASVFLAAADFYEKKYRADQNDLEKRRVMHAVAATLISASTVRLCPVRAAGGSAVGALVLGGLAVQHIYRNF